MNSHVAQLLTPALAVMHREPPAWLSDAQAAAWLGMSDVQWRMWISDGAASAQIEQKRVPSAFGHTVRVYRRADLDALAAKLRESEFGVLGSVQV